MKILVDWWVGLIVGKGLVERHRRRRAAGDTTQNLRCKPYWNRSTRPTTIGVCSGTHLATSSNTGGPSPVIGVLSSSELLAQVSSLVTAGNSEQILSSSTDFSIFSSTESMVGKPTVYMTLPERHHSCVVSHHSISSIVIGRDSLDALAIMQCCDNIIMAKSPHISSIGFRSSSNTPRALVPARPSRVTREALVKNKQLATDMEAEMRRRNIKQQQENVFANARGLLKNKAIRERKERMRQQFPPPPFAPPIANTAELEEANQTDFIFFPSLTDDGNLCPAWDIEGFSTAVNPVSEVASSKQRAPDLPRTRKLRSMVANSKSSRKQAHFMMGPPKLVRQRRPGLLASKRGPQTQNL